MVPKTSSRAVAVIVGLWVAGFAAALALATTNDRAAAQQGCGGGSSPSPSGSASASVPASDDPIPSLPVSLLPDPAPDQKKAVPEPAPLERNPSEKVPVGAAQQDTCRSTITLTYKSGRNAKFAGKVDSDEPMCKRARKVTIKKVKRGADPTVGTATTNTKGKYTAPARRANGRFYAKVSKATVENQNGETITCGAARSRTIRP
ncbi:MAG: hypothetical protein M3134_03675 [Actinomycetota bacterium]|nr:hypothetical protein [Actinomycetota bacterium]